MMKKALLCLLLLAVPASALPRKHFPIYILFATFNSKDAGPLKETIGKRTATIFGLQIWRTLRRAPTPNPQRLSFGVGGITWDFDALAPKDFIEAETLAQNQDDDNQIVLWGSASQYADGFIIEPCLSIRNTQTGAILGKGIWQVTVRKNGRPISVAVDIPSWRYEFAPVILRSDFQPGISDPTDISVYDNPNGKVVGRLVDDFVALEREGEYAKLRLRPSNRLGWIHLPRLPKLSNPNESNEVISFCGGLIRLFREDWEGAMELLKEVVTTREVPTSVKIDTFLYLAIAADKLKKYEESLSFIAEAYRLNPYAVTTTKYLCMSYLSQIANRPRAEETRKAVQSLQEILKKNRVLFPGKDPWIARVESAIASSPPNQ